MPVHADISERPPALCVSRSFSGRRWVLKEPDGEAVRALMRTAELSPVLAALLASRGVAPEAVQETLWPTLKTQMPEPFALMGMDRAVERARKAIEQGEAIAIFGDYDVDGSCSAALLHDFFRAIGIATRIYVPDRMTEGYGPSARAMSKLKDEGAQLVITVDCGAAATEALNGARAAGLDVIVLDHHRVEHPAPAFAQVNPNQPVDGSGLNHLCAAGVTFLFAVALNRALRSWYAANKIAEPDLRRVLDLVALATVCDVVPLAGVNRAFVRAGLAQLQALSRPGLAALAQVARAQSPYTAYHCGFIFGPRINAGGRVGRCSLGVDLLTAQTAEDALAHAELLDLHNRERQSIETAILEEASALAAAQHDRPFIFAAKEGWHPGVVGIVAGRLKERFGKPAFVAGFEGGMGRGSARSVAGADIGAVVRAAMQAGIVESGGGHAMAAGFALTAEQRGGFEAFLAAEFARGLPETELSLDIDALVSPSGANAALVRDVALAGPFGAGNPEPTFALADVRVAFADIVGKDHVRLKLTGGGGRLDAIAFRCAGEPLGQALFAARGRTIHAAGRLRAETWNGNLRVQLHLEDAAPASA